MTTSLGRTFTTISGLVINEFTATDIASWKVEIFLEHSETRKGRTQPESRFTLTIIRQSDIAALNELAIRPRDDAILRCRA
jgi:hypothetical protein